MIDKKISGEKILIINNGLAGGGTERASVSLANYFQSKGYSVTILAVYKSIPFYHLNHKINFIEPDFDRTQYSQSRYLIKLLLFIRANVKKIDPATILSFNEWTNAYVILALLGLQFPVYVSERMNPRAKIPSVTEFFRKKLYKYADGVITQTAFGKKVIQKSTKSKNVTVIPNPVNVIESINTTKLNRIVAIGRLESVKGHRYLIEAFSLIDEASWKLSIVGDGSEKENLIKLAEELGISSRVTFYGHLLDFRKQLSEAKIYVLPSIREGFPNSLIEAMSLPIACISGNYYEGENDLVVDGVNGLLFEPCNIEELANAMKKLINHEDLRDKLAQNSLQVREILNFDKIANRYLDVIFSHDNKKVD